jgi:hypothetical protein
MVLTVSFVLLGDEFLSPSPSGLTTLARLGRFRLRKAWHQQRMPGPHDFAVRSDPQPTLASHVLPAKLWRGVEAPFVCAPVLRPQAKPALRSPLRANAAASTASIPRS